MPEAEGRMPEAEGRMLEAEGRMPEAEGRMLEAEGRMLEAEGRMLEAEGRIKDELDAYCRHHLAGYKVPRGWQFVDALPKSASGKILKRVLRERGA
jgi:acyl-CoA synthetase (AMP-forming)/AMP-acid ligase II